MSTTWLDVPVPDGDLRQIEETATVLHASARRTAAGVDELRLLVAGVGAGTWEGRAADAFDAKTALACTALSALADDQAQAAEQVDAYARAWADAEAASKRAQRDLDDAVQTYLSAAPSALERVAGQLAGFLSGALDALLPFADDLLAGVQRALDRLGSWSPPTARPRAVVVRAAGELPRVSADGVLAALEAGGEWGASHLLDAVRAVAGWVGGAIEGAMAGVHAVERAFAAAVDAAQRVARQALERLYEAAVGAAEALGRLAVDVGQQVFRVVAQAVHAGADLVGDVLDGIGRFLHAVEQLGRSIAGLVGALGDAADGVVQGKNPRRMPDARAADEAAADRWRRDDDLQRTVIARAGLAAAAYDGTGAPDGWERLDTVVGPDGFRAAVFRDPVTGAVVVAYAGTTPTQPADWGQNAQNAGGLTTSQGQQAIALARRVVAQHGAGVSFTGHSLGGGLAALGALATGRSATTFNAAGIGDGNYAAAVRANGGRVSEAGIVNYRTPNDVLSVGLDAGGIDTAAGAQVTVASNTRNPVGAHLLDGFDWPKPKPAGAR